MQKRNTEYDAILERMDIPDIEKLLASLGTGRATGVAAGLLLTPIYPGDTVRATVSFGYRGPAFSDTLYVEIGNTIVIWVTHWFGTKAISIPQTTDYVTYTNTVDILITPATGGIGKFDIRAFLNGHSAAGVPSKPNVIEIFLRGEFQAMTIVSYDKV